MLNKKLKFFAVLIAISLALCSVNTAFAQKTDNQTQQKAKSSSLLPTKQENKNVLGKFFVTMGWVAGSCVVIYLLLLAYKRRTAAKYAPNEQIQDMSLNLDSPQSIDDAVDFVIKKF